MGDKEKYFKLKQNDRKYLEDMLYASDESYLQENISFGTLGTILINYKKIHNLA